MFVFLSHLHGMKKTTLNYFNVLTCLSIMAFPGLLLAKSFDIAVISSGKSATYSNIIESVKNTVKENNSLSVSFTIFNVDELTPSENITINNSDLLLTIGQRAMLAASKQSNSPPILATLVPKQSFQQSYLALKSTNSKVSAIYIDSPPERQIFLAKILLGQAKTIGILLSEKTFPDKSHIISTLNNVGLSPRIEDVSPNDNIIRKLSRVINNSDALLALPDPIIFNRNTARNILLTTYRQRIPVIGFSANYVKAGALAAVFSTPEQIARQTGETIISILTNPTAFPYGGTYPENFSISINQNVARSLGLRTPQKIIIKNELQKLLVKYK